ncbi:MAG: YkgJ family cysteine cluster protein [Candidatus Nezhaarchaeales archaeon]
MSDVRQKDFFNVCGRCVIECCRNAKPPITSRREEAITTYLKKQGIGIEQPFIHGDYTFPREDADGYCVFYDKKSRRCLIHPVKPETCVAGPITFDVNSASRKIEWYIKMEKICPLAGVMLRDVELLKEHIKTAKGEILRLIRELKPEALRSILKREEPDTFKIGEDDVDEDVLRALNVDTAST